MLNEFEIDLNQYDREEFTDIEKRNLKKNFKKSIKKNNSIYKKGIMAASIALLIAGLSVTTLGSNVWAYASTYVDTVASSIGNFLGIERNLDEYKTVVNKSITKDGLTIKLNEVILNKDELVVSSTFKDSEKIEGGLLLENGSIYINGKRVSYAAGGGSKIIDDYTEQSVITYLLDDRDYSGDLNIKIVYSSPIINEVKRNGKWVFEFKTNGDELAIETKKIPLNNTFTLENGQNIILKEYTSNALGLKIYFSKDKKGTEYDMVLRGNDDLGNKIEFYADSQNAKSGMFKSNIDGNLNENAKTLTLTPYAVKLPEKSGRLSNDFIKVGKEFIIELSK